MKNERWILTVDIESDSADKNTCNVVEIAAVPIHPETLEIKKDQAFSIAVKPPGIDKDEYMEDAQRKKTVAWHAKNHGVTSDEIIERWKKGVMEKTAWKNFCSYCDKYKVEKKRGQWYTEPIPAGYNIMGFDMPIFERLAAKYKTKMPLSTVTNLDAMPMLFWWFEDLDEPNNFKMDTWRKFFDMKAIGTAHDALIDVYQESEIITRFLKFHRKQSSVEKFKGSFA